MDKKTLGTHIAGLRKAAGLTQDKLAVKMGYQSTSRLGNYEAGVNWLPAAEIRDMAVALGSTPNEILMWETPGIQSRVQPDLPGHVALGRLTAFSTEPDMQEVFLPEFLVRQRVPHGTDLGVVKWLVNPSDALAPKIAKGALILVDSSQAALEDILDGEVYVVRFWGGRPDVRRIFKIGNNEFRLTGDSETARRLDLTGDDYKELAIGGRVIDAI